MMARTLWCTRCRVGYASVAGDVPTICPSCEQRAIWTTLAPMAAWNVFPLTEADKAFLKSYHIQADD